MRRVLTSIAVARPHLRHLSAGTRTILHSTEFCVRDPVAPPMADELYARLRGHLTFTGLTVGQMLARSDLERKPPILHESSTCRDVVRVMAEFKCGCVLVADNNGKVTGIFSERDYMQKVASSVSDPAQLRVGDVMDKDLVSVELGTSTLEVMQLMTERVRRRYLPVKDPVSGAVVDVVSLGDLVKAVLRETDDTVEFLNGYICGRYLNPAE